MTDMEFEGQREGEEVELVFRRHILTAWRGLFGLVLMGVIGLIPMLIWRDNQELFFLWLAFLAVGLVYALNVYMKWYFSYFLVTNQRIREVKQQGFFRKEVIDLGLDKILTIKYKTGILGGIFGYGTLTLQTPLSGGAGEMVITMVRKPQKIYNLLQDLASKVEG
jgi:uncharacterized membrane protein YdbT with pleckstrin-like domain